MTDEEMAKESYKEYSEGRYIDSYEGYQYIDGFITGLIKGRKEVFVYNDGIPEDKDKLCIFYDYDGYFIDTFNNLSSSDQKNLKKWIYLPLLESSIPVKMEKK